MLKECAAEYRYWITSSFLGELRAEEIRSSCLVRGTDIDSFWQPRYTQQRKVLGLSHKGCFYSNEERLLKRSFSASLQAHCSTDNCMLLKMSKGTRKPAAVNPNASIWWPGISMETEAAHKTPPKAGPTALQP